MTISAHNSRRILVCDDEAAVIEAYRRILTDLVVPQQGAELIGFDALSAELFGDDAVTTDSAPVLDEIVYCRQGEDAIEAFAQARRQGQPFGAVFMDVRMPPGIDGVEAAKRIRILDPSVNIVMVTGYSDRQPAQIAGLVGAEDRLFYLVKPFDADEVRQLATTLTNRWASDLVLANELATRLEELERLNDALRASEASAQRAARKDPLTGLLNRKGFEEEFAKASGLALEAGEGIVLLYIDLDRFKLVNDTHGHGIGDEFIREVARRIQVAVGPAGVVARIGGDEFAIICSAEGELPSLLDRLLATTGSPLTAGVHQLPVSLSIGYSKCGPHGVSLAEAMRQADIALYSAKAAGRGRARAFSPKHDQDLLRSRRLSEDLKQAIQTNSLMLHYQPLMSADGQRVTGLEALLRWNHVQHGAISPQVFVSLAEQNDLMTELGDWVLRQAMQDVRLWPDLVTSINLSAAQFARPDFADKVIELARAMGVSTAMIEFEITETALSNDMASFTDQVRKLSQAGFQFALDDFGSGYASIGYLSKLQFDKLKIDRSFVSELGAQPNADRLIRSMVSLGDAMGLTVTAEGVEEVFQHEMLKSAGCNQMQGYLFYKPCSREEIQMILSQQPTAACVA